jgi:hypothetical protein
MIDVIDKYEECRDAINTEENGNLSYQRFNRMAWSGQLMAIGILTGRLSGITPPVNYVTQKSKDLLTPLIKRETKNVQDGTMPKPKDYYTYDTMMVFGSDKDTVDCDKVAISGINTPIQILDSAEFEFRANTFIEGMKPTIQTPIAKLEGNEFHFLPKDLGTVKLVYIKNPPKAKIGIKINQVTNNEEIDVANTVNFEWDENASELLTYCIVQEFSMWNREDNLAQRNELKLQKQLG